MKAKGDQKSNHRYSSDRPIKRVSEDQLNRGSFATRLADDLATWKGNDSMVIGLYGDWGAGKTSLKNLVLEALKKRRSKMPILEFNPWQISGKGGITESFFNELKITLGNNLDEKGEMVSQIRTQLEQYSKRLAFGGTIAGVAAPLLGVLGQFEAAAVALAAAENLKQTADVVKSGSEALNAKPKPSEISLVSLKRSLSEALRGLKRSVLVVIDDIDRLSSKEIREVFQLVKANADFPRIVYLLLFERNVVCKALNKISGKQGYEFLEKIVQVGYHVPHASREAIQKVLFQGLDAQLNQPGMQRRWDKSRWTDLYFDGMAGFFRNLRHVYRFLSSFNFHVGHLQTGEYFEVNPIDLLGLETLRVFEPSVYESLASFRRMLTRDSEGILLERLPSESYEDAIKEISSNSSANRRKQVNHIIRSLFPAISREDDRGSLAILTQDWMREARVCYPKFFERYFTLRVREGELAQSELDMLIDSASTPETFTRRLASLNAQNLMVAAFDHLEAHKEHIPLQDMPALIRGLADASDSFPDSGPSMFATDVRLGAARLIYFGLRRVPEEQRRSEILIEAFERSNGVLLPVFFTATEMQDQSSRSSPTQFVSENTLNSLKQISLRKIEHAASQDQLIGHPQFPFILGRWIAWDPDRVRPWFQEELVGRGRVCQLLPAFLNESWSSGRENVVKYSMKLSSIERVADVSIIKRCLDEIGEACQDDRSRIGVSEFRRATERRDRGEAEESQFAGVDS